MNALANRHAIRSPTPSPRDLFVVFAIAVLALLTLLVLRQALSSPLQSSPFSFQPDSGDVAARH